MAPMPIVEFIMIKRYAHVYLTILDVHQIVDPNVLWILIAQQRWLVSAINVKPRAMVHADPTHTAPSSITELIVSAKMDLLAIHTLDAAKLFSVRNFDRISLKSARVSLKSLHFCFDGFQKDVVKYTLRNCANDCAEFAISLA